MKSIVALMLPAALLVAGCGSAQSQAASAAAAKFLAAVEDDDVAAACDLLSQDTRESLEAAEHAPCEEAFPDLRVPEEPGEVEVWGDRAQARSAAGTVFLVELDAGWRISAAGCERSVENTYTCTLAGS